MADEMTDPLRNYNFTVSIGDPGGEAHFTECSGLGIKVHTIRYREAGAKQLVRTLPGAVEYSDVTLRYGLTNSLALWQWLMDTTSGNVAKARREVSIIVLNPDGVGEALRWNLHRAFPSEWVGAAFDAMGRSAAIEYLKLSFDEIVRA
jgi:phage tail-like protein